MHLSSALHTAGSRLLDRLFGVSKSQPGILSDHEIIHLCETEQMIFPYHPQLVRSINNRRVLSFGTSSYGYDLRVSSTVKIYHGVCDANPKHSNDKCWRDLPVLTDEEGCEYVLIPPQTFFLCHSIEYVNLPADVTAIVLNKSTYARMGMINIASVGEAGWHGTYVLEGFNALPVSCRLYIGEGIVQLLFLRGAERCSTSYGDRSGKYQGQRGLTHAKV